MLRLDSRKNHISWCTRKFCSSFFSPTPIFVMVISGTDNNIPVAPHRYPKNATLSKMIIGCIRIFESDSINLISTRFPKRNFNAHWPANAVRHEKNGAGNRESNKIIGNGRTIATNGPIYFCQREKSKCVTDDGNFHCLKTFSTQFFMKTMTKK